MDAGALPFRRAGAHRRLRRADVMETERHGASMRAALDDLPADKDEVAAHGL
ncbi:MAG: hypothetical protein ABSC95_03730 [Acetobacteraceae bacterium]|jgi:hypothetical protein